MKKNSFIFLVLLLLFPLLGCQTAQQLAVTSTTTTSSPTTSSSTTTSTTTTTLAAANIVLKGSVHKSQDSTADIKFFGELQNIGGANASFIQITFTMKDSSGMIIDTASSYLTGSVLKLSLSTTNTGLWPGEYGAFEVYTTVPFSSVDSFTYNIEWENYPTTIIYKQC